jgi:hypothetical protein
MSVLWKGNAMTKKELSKLYDEFYQRGIEILEKHNNPCKPNKWGTCENTWQHFCCGYYGKFPVKNYKEWKNTSCMFLEKDRRKKKQGCTVKSLFCKMWLCGQIQNKYPKLAMEMGELETKVRKIFPEVEYGYKKEYVIDHHMEKYYGRQN